MTERERVNEEIRLREIKHIMIIHGFLRYIKILIVSLREMGVFKVTLRDPRGEKSRLENWSPAIRCSVCSLAFISPIRHDFFPSVYRPDSYRDIPLKIVMG